MLVFSFIVQWWNLKNLSSKPNISIMGTQAASAPFPDRWKKSSPDIGNTSDLDSETEVARFSSVYTSYY